MSNPQNLNNVALRLAAVSVLEELLKECKTPEDCVAVGMSIVLDALRDEVALLPTKFSLRQRLEGTVTPIHTGSSLLKAAHDRLDFVKWLCAQASEDITLANRKRIEKSLMTRKTVETENGTQPVAESRVSRSSARNGKPKSHKGRGA